MFTLIKLVKAMSILEQLERLIQITQTEVFKTKNAIFCPLEKLSLDPLLPHSLSFSYILHCCPLKIISFFSCIACWFLA